MNQLSLFDNLDVTTTADIAVPAQPVISPVETKHSDGDTPLTVAVNRYLDAQLREGRSYNTIKSRHADLELLASFVGGERSISSFALSDLAAFLKWTQTPPRQCKPRTLERRITSLRSFFKWLADTLALADNPAAQLKYHIRREHLPKLPSAAQMQAVIAAARNLDDPRPLALVDLIVATGIKKGELMNLALGDITTQSVAVRHINPKTRWKSRRLPLPQHVAETLWHYRESTSVVDAGDLWFPYHKRLIEDLVAAAGEAAGLEQRLSCENLRWVYAVNAMQSGLDPEILRQRLALSPQWWGTTWKKIKALSRLREELPLAR